MTNMINEYMDRLEEENDKLHEQTWFVLFDGSSEDGRGNGSYHSRTTNKKIARDHYKKCAKNPYSCGKVLIVTNEIAENATHWTDWDALQ